MYILLCDTPHFMVRQPEVAKKLDFSSEVLRFPHKALHCGSVYGKLLKGTVKHVTNYVANLKFLPRNINV
jgi:hypothetical protein